MTRKRRDPALDLLGLSARAGAVVAGLGRVREAVRDGSVRFVVVAADAAGPQRSKLEPLLRVRGVPYVSVLTRAILGSAIGRAPVSAVGVTDAGLARRLAGELEDPARSRDR